MEPDSAFHTRFTVRIGDINYGGHLGNDKFLLLFHDARIRFLESLGFSEMDIGNGTGLIMKDAYVEFKGEVFLHDELRVFVTAADIERIRFRLEYRVERRAERNTEQSAAAPDIIAAGYTNMAAFDYGQRKIARLPENFIEKLSIHG